MTIGTRKNVFLKKFTDRIFLKNSSIGQKGAKSRWLGLGGRIRVFRSIFELSNHHYSTQRRRKPRKQKKNHYESSTGLFCGSILSCLSIPGKSRKWPKMADFDRKIPFLPTTYLTSLNIDYLLVLGVFRCVEFNKNNPDNQKIPFDAQKIDFFCSIFAHFSQKMTYFDQN